MASHRFGSPFFSAILRAPPHLPLAHDLLTRATTVDTRSLLLDDEDPTQIDKIPAPLLHALLVPPPKKKPSMIPPPLPLSLTRKVEPARLTESDEVWLGTLPLATRAVLEAARRAPSEWPSAPRLEHAVIRPVVGDGTVPLVSAELELIDA